MLTGKKRHVGNFRNWIILGKPYQEESQVQTSKFSSQSTAFGPTHHQPHKCTRLYPELNVLQGQFVWREVSKDSKDKRLNVLQHLITLIITRASGLNVVGQKLNVISIFQTIISQLRSKVQKLVWCALSHLRCTCKSDSDTDFRSKSGAWPCCLVCFPGSKCIIICVRFDDQDVGENNKLQE